MRAIGTGTRRRKQLEKRLAGTAGLSVRPGSCKGTSGTCCRKQGKFAPCGAPGSAADFCFRPSSRSCCRDERGRFIGCQVPAHRDELAQLRRLDERRQARLAKRRDEQRVLAANPPRRRRRREELHLVGAIVRQANGKRVYVTLGRGRAAT